MNAAKNVDKLKITFEQKDDYQITNLFIYKTAVDDYGNYKCKADNNLGSAETSIQVTGKFSVLTHNFTDCESLFFA